MGSYTKEQLASRIVNLRGIENVMSKYAFLTYYKRFDEPVMQYVGIAADEPIRLARMKDNQISLLAKYGYTEEMAMNKCIQYGLVSPIYESSHRGGCWFCPNCKIKVFAE